MTIWACAIGRVMDLHLGRETGPDPPSTTTIVFRGIESPPGVGVRHAHISHYGPQGMPAICCHAQALLLKWHAGQYHAVHMLGAAGKRVKPNEQAAYRCSEMCCTLAAGFAKLLVPLLLDSSSLVPFPTGSACAASGTAPKEPPQQALCSQANLGLCEVGRLAGSQLT